VVWPCAAPFRIASDDTLKPFLIGTSQCSLEAVLLTVGGGRVNLYGSGLSIQAPHLVVNRIDA
jgi:hypothetical protein